MDDIQFLVEDNVLALENHLQCAAEELPIDIEKDQIYFASKLKEVCKSHLISIGDNVRFYLTRPFQQKNEKWDNVYAQVVNIYYIVRN